MKNKHQSITIFIDFFWLNMTIEKKTKEETNQKKRRLSWDEVNGSLVSELVARQNQASVMEDLEFEVWINHCLAVLTLQARRWGFCEQTFRMKFCPVDRVRFTQRTLERLKREGFAFDEQENQPISTEEISYDIRVAESCLSMDQPGDCLAFRLLRKITRRLLTLRLESYQVSRPITRPGVNSQSLRIPLIPDDLISTYPYEGPFDTNRWTPASNKWVAWLVERLNKVNIQGRLSLLPGEMNEETQQEEYHFIFELAPSPPLPKDEFMFC